MGQICDQAGEFGGSDLWFDWGVRRVRFNFARVRSLTTAEEDFRQLQELDRKIKSFQVSKQWFEMPLKL